MSEVTRVECDVVIIGAGGAGVAAAIEVANAGAKALLIERAVELGGTAAISGGGCLVVGTPLQQAQGIKDNPDLAFEDWVTYGKGAADEEWARFYIEHSLADFYYWTERQGVEWIDLKLLEGNRVARWHRPRKNGLGLMMPLIHSLQSYGRTEIVSNSEANSLVMENGRIAGVTATCRTTILEIYGRAVIVASGGFNSNL